MAAKKPCVTEMRAAMYGLESGSKTSLTKRKGLTPQEVCESCDEPEDETEKYAFQQTNIRVKDPKKSLAFYTHVLGMRLFKHLDFPDMQFSLYFLGYGKGFDIPTDASARTAWTFKQSAVLELTHNYGTEADPDQHYHNGNSEPRGFGHIGIGVPDVDVACERFDKMGIKFVKRANEGSMKNIAVVQDPDGYWIEILCGDNMPQLAEKAKQYY